MLQKQSLNLTITVAIVITWMVYIYNDELELKQKFITKFRNVKEYLKLHSLSHIFMHKNVRSTMAERVAKVHTDVTVLFCEIDDFDDVVRTYESGLIEILEQL